MLKQTNSNQKLKKTRYNLDKNYNKRICKLLDLHYLKKVQTDKKIFMQLE